MEILSFETIGNYHFGIRYVEYHGELLLAIYAATSDPVEVNGKVEERYNLVDEDGNTVGDVSLAAHIFDLGEIFIHDNNLFFSILFNEDYGYVTFSEFEAIYELIDTLKPKLHSMLNSKSLEFTNGSV